MKYFSITLLLIQLFISVSTSFAQIDPTLAQDLQDALDNVCSSKNIKGASTAIVMPDFEIWTGVSGISHDTVEITPDMLFNIGSITKNYTAPLILELAEEGILTLEDSLHEWLPTYDNIDSTITIRQLLNMTSGLYDFYNDNPDIFNIIRSNLSRFWTQEEILTSLVGPPINPPGTEWRYSTTNYNLLGMIIREATGSSVSSELRNRFLDSRSLNNTFLPPEDTLIGDIAHPWNQVKGGLLQDNSVHYDTALFSLVWTGGSMFSTAKEVALWSHDLFGGAVLDSNYTNQMVTFDTVNVPGYPPEATGYGLGAWRYKMLGKEIWGGVGVNPGYVSYVLYLPDDSISIAVLLNEIRWSYNFDATLRNAFSILYALLGTVSVIENENTVMPLNYILKQNYPNPFNPSTTIKFHLSSEAGNSQFTTLKVYDILGKEVATLVSEKLHSGNHTYQFDGRNLASGVYYYQLRTDAGFIQTKKMVLLR
jgi:D-alanyl-D-alanine carboxypeptidase